MMWGCSYAWIVLLCIKWGIKLNFTKFPIQKGQKNKIFYFEEEYIIGPMIIKGLCQRLQISSTVKRNVRHRFIPNFSFLKAYLAKSLAKIGRNCPRDSGSKVRISFKATVAFPFIWIMKKSPIICKTGCKNDFVKQTFC